MLIERLPVNIIFCRHQSVSGIVTGMEAETLRKMGTVIQHIC